MRILGAAAAALVVLSFILWLTGWIYWNFLGTFGPTVGTVMQGVSVTGIVLEYLAILLAAIGVILGGGKGSGQ